MYKNLFSHCFLKFHKVIILKIVFIEEKRASKIKWYNKFVLYGLPQLYLLFVGGSFVSLPRSFQWYFSVIFAGRNPFLISWIKHSDSKHFTEINTSFPKQKVLTYCIKTVQHTNSIKKHHKRSSSLSYDWIDSGITQNQSSTVILSNSSLI